MWQSIPSLAHALDEVAAESHAVVGKTVDGAG
jgi:hypothetical protein